MKILVTGNLGYVGPVVTRLAKERGHLVTGLDVGYFKDSGSSNGTEVPADKQIWRDIRDVRAEDLDGIEAIIHLAGLSNDALGEFEPRLTHEINFVSTIRLAEVAKVNGVGRFVFASSCAIYGAAPDESSPLDEAAPLRPLSAYAASKAAAEAGLSTLADESFSPVFLRCGTAFGVSRRTRFDLVVNNLAGWAHATGVVKITSDGKQWRPVVHVEDMSQAALAAAEATSQSIHNQAFNIGRADANYRVLQIAEAVRAAIPGSRVKITGEAGPDPRSYRVDPNKALRTLPTFEPRWTLEMGLEEVARFLRDDGLEGRAFDSSGYIRLKHLRAEIERRRLDRDLRIVESGPG